MNIKNTAEKPNAELSAAHSRISEIKAAMFDHQAALENLEKELAHAVGIARGIEAVSQRGIVVEESVPDPDQAKVVAAEPA